MHIVVNTSFGRTIYLMDVNTNITVEEVKKLIQDAEGIPIYQQKLFIGDLILENNNIILVFNQQIVTLACLDKQFNKIKDQVISVYNASNKKAATLYVSSSFYKISEIKEKIEDIAGIPFSHQTLSLDNNKPLENDSVLDPTTQHILYLKLENDKFVHIYIKIFNKELITLKVETTVTIEDVKKKIEIKDEDGMDYSQKILLYNNEKLEDGKNLSDYNIMSKSLLHLIPLRNHKFQISVNFLSEKNIILDVHGSDTIESVKAQIQEKEKISIHHQILFFADEKLENERTLSSYEIQTDSTLDLLPNFRESMVVSIKNFVGKIIELEVNASDTIQKVKKMIQDREQIPSSLQKLYFANEELKDRQTLKDYNIHVNSLRYLSLRLKGKMRIFIKSPTDTFSCMVKFNDTIENVKTEIEKKIGIPIDQQMLFYCSELEDRCTIADYEIKIDSTLILLQKKQSIKEDIQIIIRNWTFSRDTHLDINPNETKNIKFKTEGSLKIIPIKLQNLSVNDQPLIAESTSSDNDIENRSIISVNMNLPGN